MWFCKILFRIDVSWRLKINICLNCFCLWLVVPDALYLFTFAYTWLLHFSVWTRSGMCLWKPSQVQRTIHVSIWSFQAEPEKHTRRGNLTSLTLFLFSTWFGCPPFLHLKFSASQNWGLSSLSWSDTLSLRKSSLCPVVFTAAWNYFFP